MKWVVLRIRNFDLNPKGDQYGSCQAFLDPYKKTNNLMADAYYVKINLSAHQRVRVLNKPATATGDSCFLKRTKQLHAVAISGLYRFPTHIGSLTS